MLSAGLCNNYDMLLICRTEFSLEEDYTLLARISQLRDIRDIRGSRTWKVLKREMASGKVFFDL